MRSRTLFQDKLISGWRSFIISSVVAVTSTYTAPMLYVSLLPGDSRMIQKLAKPKRKPPSYVAPLPKAAPAATAPSPSLPSTHLPSKHDFRAFRGRAVIPGIFHVRATKVPPFITELTSNSYVITIAHNLIA
jgi:hypothetical protein